MPAPPSRVSCAWEPLGKLLDDPSVRGLIEEYWSELSPIKDVAVLAPDWPQFLANEASGRFKVWAARVDGTLAGFVSFHIYPHLAYRHTLVAIDGGHYLAAEYRDNGRIGWRMWKSAGAALKREGVKIAMLHDNAMRPLMPFFLALGAEPRSTMFWWRL